MPFSFQILLMLVLYLLLLILLKFVRKVLCILVKIYSRLWALIQVFANLRYLDHAVIKLEVKQVRAFPLLFWDHLQVLWFWQDVSIFPFLVSHVNLKAFIFASHNRLFTFVVSLSLLQILARIDFLSQTSFCQLLSFIKAVFHFLLQVACFFHLLILAPVNALF